jgi:protein-S-isoprenylcysteine O-methyltransferase Ste14
MRSDKLKDVLTNDYVLRIPLASLFGLMVFGSCMKLVRGWDSLDGLSRLSTVSTLIFVLLFFSLTVIRRKPISKSRGLRPLLLSFFGAFLTLFLPLLPDAQIPASVKTIAILMIIAGTLLSAWAVSWLGRSASVAPQARRLVTGGPYQIVRHPLYLFEEIAIIGIVLVKLGAFAVVIGAVHWFFQLRRMHEEEKVLGEVFADYEDYSATVPRIIPKMRGRKCEASTVSKSRGSSPRCGSPVQQS